MREQYFGWGMRIPGSWKKIRANIEEDTLERVDIENRVGGSVDSNNRIAKRREIEDRCRHRRPSA